MTTSIERSYPYLGSRKFPTGNMWVVLLMPPWRQSRGSRSLSGTETHVVWPRISRYCIGSPLKLNYRANYIASVMCAEIEKKR